MFNIKQGCRLLFYILAETGIFLANIQTSFGMYM